MKKSVVGDFYINAENGYVVLSNSESRSVISILTARRSSIKMLQGVGTGKLKKEAQIVAMALIREADKAEKQAEKLKDATSVLVALEEYLKAK